MNTTTMTASMPTILRMSIYQQQTTTTTTNNNNERIGYLGLGIMV